jgi:hypothetical protein
MEFSRSDALDGDGYPREETLERIAAWPARDYNGLLDYVADLWCYPDYVVKSPEARTYVFATGGWSGNESLISALEQNLVFWGTCWMSSRRGGRYEFVVPVVFMSGSSK